MSNENLLRRITVDPEICHGMPYVRGLRYPVETIRSVSLGTAVNTDDFSPRACPLPLSTTQERGEDQGEGHSCMARAKSLLSPALSSIQRRRGSVGLRLGCAREYLTGGISVEETPAAFLDLDLGSYGLLEIEPNLSL